MRIFMIALAVAIAGCSGHSHGEEDGHSHDSGLPVMDSTIWNEHAELYVEFPVLVKGQKSKFAAHFTIMENHKPVEQGEVTVSLIKGGKGIRSKVPEPSSPGIYTPALEPVQEGLHQLVFDLVTPHFTERFIMDEVMVYPNTEEVSKDDHEEASGNEISFLKEQAWKTEFKTVKVTKKPIYEVIPTSGVWKVSPSGFQSVVAGSGGAVAYAGTALTEGSIVKKGQVVMTVSSSGLTSRNLTANVQKARAEFEQAESEYLRKKELFDSKIVPKAEYEKSESAYKVAKAEYETLSRGFSPKGKQVRSPIDGYIKSVEVKNGDFVEEGATLFTVTSRQAGLLEIFVDPSYVTRLEQVRDVWYQPVAGKWTGMNENGGKLLSISNKVSAENPLLSVFAEVKGMESRPEGSFTEVNIGIGNGKPGLVVPAGALLEDYGRYSVIVQVSGESFERRTVVPGAQNGEEVQILEGLREGEVVVSRGAYQVKMASMSGQAPAHGHAH